jgi:glycosyltransferase involved in cell wall biosynthesis
MSQWFIHQGLRILMVVYLSVMHVLRSIGPQKRAVNDPGCDILITGTFYSENWVLAHLRPLAASHHCARVRVVSVYPIPPIEKVEVIYPPNGLVRLIGGVPARLLTFLWVGFRSRPHIVGGFHLLFNGLVSALLGRLIGAYSMYFCVGGPAEVLEGGILSENRLFERLKTPDRIIEGQLLRAIDSFDFVITMGKGAIDFFRKRGVLTRFHVVSGGIDTNRFHSSESTSYIADLIWVGRLTPIKRADVFLHAIKNIKRTLPNVKALIVGDGPLRESLEKTAQGLGVQNNVTFVGFQQDIEKWLKRSKVFVLTSDSEGLSLAVMEAMLCGLPAVVSNVGDLNELVEDGVNGYLVKKQDPQMFALPITNLLQNAEHLALFSGAARRSAERYEIGAASRSWDKIFSSFGEERL